MISLLCGEAEQEPSKAIFDAANRLDNEVF